MLSHVAAFPRSSVVALVWPKDAPAPPPIEPPAEAMPVLRKGKYRQGCGLSADTAAEMG